MFQEDFETRLVMALPRIRGALEQIESTADFPVPPEFFGPLWPYGEPEGWPEEGKEPRSHGAEFILEVEVPDDASDGDVVLFVADIADDIDDVHRAYGGCGVRVKRIDIEMPSLVPEEVTS